MESRDIAKNNGKLKETDFYTKKFSATIKELLSNPQQDDKDGDILINEISFKIDAILKLINKCDTKNELIQKEIFDQVCNFLNSLFKELDIKKFYNNIPKTNIRKYAELDIGQKFIHNIYGKERKLFYKSAIEGGDCYYRTIFLKDLFDKLKNAGLNIKYKFFISDEKWGHSGLLIHFQDKDYIADFNGLNEVYGNIIIQSLNDLKQQSASNFFDCFNRDTVASPNKKHTKPQIKTHILFLDDISSFYKQLTKNRKSGYTIEFKPKFNGYDSTNIRFDFIRQEQHPQNKIVLEVNGHKHSYGLNPKLLEEGCKQNGNDIINTIIKSIMPKKEISLSGHEYFTGISTGEKQELEKYLELIVDKINIQELKNLYLGG